MKIKNKNGTGKVISIYWFVIIFLVTAAVAYMVGTFYGKPYDVRELEASLLADKVADCVSYAGYMRENVLESMSSETFLDFCGMTFEVEDTSDWKQQVQYYVNVEIFDFENYQIGNSIKSVSVGNPNLDDFCGFEGKLPVCAQKEMYVLGKEGQKYLVKINVSVGKTAKNEI